MGGTDKSPEEQAKTLFLISMASIVIFGGIAYVLVLHGAL